MKKVFGSRWILVLLSVGLVAVVLFVSTIIGLTLVTKEIIWKNEEIHNLVEDLEVAKLKKSSSDTNATMKDPDTLDDATIMDEEGKSEPPIPLTAEESVDVIKAAIRRATNKPLGKLTKEDLKKVTELELEGYQLTDISALAGLTQLETLYLQNNHLTDVSALAGLTQLKWLFLYNNHLTDVSALAGLTQLERLDLGTNKLTDVRALAGLTQLKWLFLNYNRLTDDQLKHLEEFTHMNTLYLYNNPDLTKTQIDQLQKALSKCRIAYNATK